MEVVRVFLLLKLMSTAGAYNFGMLKVKWTSWRGRHIHQPPICKRFRTDTIGISVHTFGVNCGIFLLGFCPRTNQPPWQLIADAYVCPRTDPSEAVVGESCAIGMFHTNISTRFYRLRWTFKFHRVRGKQMVFHYIEPCVFWLVGFHWE